MASAVVGVLPQTTPEAAAWGCPNCRDVTGEAASLCPRCGLQLVQRTPTIDTESLLRELRSITWRFWLAMLLTFPLFAVTLATNFSGAFFTHVPLTDVQFLLIQAILCTPIILVCGWPLFVKAWSSLRTLRFDVSSLVGLGAGAAYLSSVVALVYAFIGAPAVPQPTTDEPQLGAKVAEKLEQIAPVSRNLIEPFFDSAAAVILFTLLGQVLELRAGARSIVAIQKLLRLAPTTARVVLADGTEEVRPLTSVQAGDMIRVRAGERVPVDGIIREGTTTVDDSMLTGEPTRQERGPGKEILAGSENGLGTVVIEAVRIKDDTVLSRIIGLVEQAQQRRIVAVRHADRIASWFVPTVLGVSCATFALWMIFAEDAITPATACAVGVLVVACPCAVGLAAPIAAVVGMRRAARGGAVLRDAANLEALATVDTVVFDKTGTVTEGRPKLIAVESNLGVSPEWVLELAAAVERGSHHPFGLAIVWEAARHNRTTAATGPVEEVPGKGVRGEVGGERVVVGRLGFLQESGIYRDLMVSEAIARQLRGHGTVFVGHGDRCIGLIAFEDKVRPDSAAAVSELVDSGLRVIMLTGDADTRAKAVAREVGITEVVADTLPVEKYALVQKLKGEGRIVAMCGDGVNDAPALAAADVGIAVSTATRAAILAAGVTLTTPSLSAVQTAREVSRATATIIRQNLFIVFLYYAVAIPIAAGLLVPLGGGFISSLWATVAMVVSVLLVVVNSARLFFTRVKAPRRHAAKH